MEHDLFRAELVGKSSFMDGICFAMELLRKLEDEYPEYRGARYRIFEKVYSNEEHKKIWNNEAANSAKKAIKEIY